MNRKPRQGLGALVAIGMAALSIGAGGCAGNEYNVPAKDKCVEEGRAAEECCVNIEGCGQLCYEGMDGGNFSITLNGKIFMYSTAEKHLYPCGCHLETGKIDSKRLVVTHRQMPSLFP